MIMLMCLDDGTRIALVLVGVICITCFMAYYQEGQSAKIMNSFAVRVLSLICTQTINLGGVLVCVSSRTFHGWLFRDRFPFFSSYCCLLLWVCRT